MGARFISQSTDGDGAPLPDVVHEDNSSVVKAKVEVFKEFDLNLFSLETQRFAKLTTGN